MRGTAWSGGKTVSIAEDLRVVLSGKAIRPAVTYGQRSFLEELADFMRNAKRGGIRIDSAPFVRWNRLVSLLCLAIFRGIGKF